MGPTSYFNMVFSGLTISFMEDFGYYKGNYQMEEYLMWAKETQCDAFAGSCDTHPHVCNTDSMICSLDQKSMGVCGRDRFVENCPVFKEVPFQDCMHAENKENLVKEGSVIGAQNMRFGKQSRCVRGILDMNQIEIVRCLGLGCNAVPSCLKLECDYEKEVSRIYTPQGATPEFHECSAAETNAYKAFTMILEGGIPTVGTFILCPNYRVVCDKQLYCPEDCNLNGRCLKNGSCWCYYGWRGNSCSEKIPDDQLAKQFEMLNAADFTAFLQSSIAILLALFVPLIL